MKNAVNRNRSVIKCDVGPLAGVCSDADDAAGLECRHHTTKGFITRFFERAPLFSDQLVWCPVSPAGLEKSQRAPVPDEETIEKRLGGRESILNPLPKSSPADLASSTLETGDRPLGMFVFGAIDLSGDSEELTDMRDLSKWYPGLCHSPGTGVHAEKQRLYTACSETIDVIGHRLGCIGERRVDMRHGFRKGQGFGVGTKDADDFLE